MQICNQHPHRSLPNVAPQKFHLGDHDTLDSFLNQICSEKVVKKIFNACDTIRINRTTNIFHMVIYLWSTELFKV